MTFHGEVVEDYKSCGYSECIYSEYDTGYSEYGCTLGDSNPEEVPCIDGVDGGCPLCCKYEVTEDG